MDGKLIGLALCMLIVASIVQPSSDTKGTGYKSQFICIFEEEGRFESGGWIIDKKVTKGDFDDTYKIRWAQYNYKGIYAEVRDDEDLWDETAEEGAWCCAAEEHGGLFRSEHSEGWAEIKRSFRLKDWLGDSVYHPYFGITSASIGFDYKIEDWSLNHRRTWVCLRVYLSLNDVDDCLVGSLCWGEKYESSSTRGKENNVRWKDMENGESVCDFLSKNRFKNIILKFKLEISLYGRMYGIRRVLLQDRLMFWLDDVKICLVYRYDTSNPLIHPLFNDTVGVNTFDSASENPEGCPACHCIYRP
ncbi:MAG: hypothetical protein HXS46_07260 [Theionarchaea archaeon]|nr:MAG: hypothetical protein AYK18_18465 [Theionarchaea archaeon DG-70]MBU7010472.1 hypothetical protein [Theionarchaea archaeon]